MTSFTPFPGTWGWPSFGFASSTIKNGCPTFRGFRKVGTPDADRDVVSSQPAWLLCYTARFDCEKNPENEGIWNAQLSKFAKAGAAAFLLNQAKSDWASPPPAFENAKRGAAGLVVTQAGNAESWNVILGEEPG